MKNRYRYDDVDIDPAEQIGPHMQQDWELSLVTNGSGIRTIAGSHRSFAVNDLVLIAPHVQHCWEFDNTGNTIGSISLFLSSAFLREIADIMPGFKNIVERIMKIETAVELTGETRNRIIGIMKSMRQTTDDTRTIACLEIIRTIGHSPNLLCGALPKAQIADKIFDTVRLYIECNYNNNACIGMAARKTGMSKTALCSMLRRKHNTTFTEMVNNERVRHAIEMLRYTSANIEQIAYDCGFSSLSYFDKVFKHHTGLSPRAYRNT